MLRIKDPKFWETLRKRYEDRLKEIESKLPRWEAFDFYGQSVGLEITPDMQMDRLWDSTKDLDLIQRHVRGLIKHGRKRTGEFELVDKMEEIEEQIDYAIALARPPLKKLTYDRGNLQKALKNLEAAFETFKQIYIDVSLKLEARRGGWIETTPSIYQHLRDAVHALRKWLEWDAIRNVR